MSEPALTLRGVRKRYGDRTVLDGIDLDIPVGTVCGLVGRNGAGKSTMIKCALGLIRRHEGTITVLGDRAPDLSPAVKARIGYAPQVSGLYPWMRVDQMIAYTAAFYERWNHALMDRLVTEWVIDRSARIQILSPGQSQQLAIILALGHRPDLLVLDEPAAALDPVARRRFLAAVLEVALDGGRTVLFSTHLISDLERVADRVVVLKNGAIAFSGELGELKDRVKRLRGDHLGNAVPGSVLSRRADGERTVLTVQASDPAEWATLAQRGVEVEDLGLEDIFVEMTA
jgi:ABC-2 type transport system ATP-binding protein